MTEDNCAENGDAGGLAEPGEFRKVTGTAPVSASSTMLGGAGVDLLTPFEEGDICDGEEEDEKAFSTNNATMEFHEEVGFEGQRGNYGASVPFYQIPTANYPRDKANVSSDLALLGIDRKRFCSGGNLSRHTSAPSRNPAGRRSEFFI